MRVDPGTQVALGTWAGGNPELRIERLGEPWMGQGLELDVAASDELARCRVKRQAVVLDPTPRQRPKNPIVSFLPQ
jgi:hypothetical protein